MKLRQIGWHGAAIGALLLATGGGLASDQPVIVFRAGDDGYHTFRIPVLLSNADGELLAIAEGRRHSPRDDGAIDLVLKRSSDGGRRWGPLEQVQHEDDDDAGGVTIGNPSAVVDRLAVDQPHRIWLLFCRNNERVFVSSSDDAGRTWSPRREITATAKHADWGWYATGPVHAIQLQRGPHAGRLVVPCDHVPRKRRGWGTHVVLSDDHGKTWRVGAVDTHPSADDVHPNECAVVELADGRLYFNARNQSPAKGVPTRVVTWSDDGGETFASPFAVDAQFRGPVVQGSLTRIEPRDTREVRDLLVYAGPASPRTRRDLALQTSADGGRTWSPARVFARGPAAYCDVVPLGAGRIGVLYESGSPLYQQIAFQTVQVDPVPAGERAAGSGRRD